MYIRVCHLRTSFISPLLWKAVTPSIGAAVVLVEVVHCFNNVPAEDLCHTASPPYEEASNASTVVNVPMVTLFFFLPFNAVPFTFRGMVAVAATTLEVFWEIESVGGDDEDELPSTSLPFVTPLLYAPMWLALNVSILGGTKSGVNESDFRLLTGCIWAVLVGGIGGKGVWCSKDLSIIAFGDVIVVIVVGWEPLNKWPDSLRLSPFELSMRGSVLEFWWYWCWLNFDASCKIKFKY